MIIKLVVTSKLEKDEIKKWFRTVKECLPEGTLGTIVEKDKVLKLKVNHHDGYSEYIVPITRYLTDDEAEDIVVVWNEEFPDGDFQIETDDVPEETDVEAPTEDYLMAESVSRMMHESWLKKMQKAGWRYGPKYSYDDKTHPRALTWDQLSDKDIDVDLIEQLRGVFGETE